MLVTMYRVHIINRSSRQNETSLNLYRDIDEALHSTTSFHPDEYEVYIEPVVCDKYELIIK